jgi:hypothetical protein
LAISPRAYFPSSCFALSLNSALSEMSVRLKGFFPSYARNFFRNQAGLPYTLPFFGLNFNLFPPFFTGLKLNVGDATRLDCGKNGMEKKRE